MRGWKELELRRSDGRPEVGRLVVLRVEPKSKNPFLSVRHYVGVLSKVDPRSDKLWFVEGAGGSFDPAKVKQHNKVFWTYVEPFGL